MFTDSTFQDTAYGPTNEGSTVGYSAVLSHLSHAVILHYGCKYTAVIILTDDEPTNEIASPHL